MLTTVLALLVLTAPVAPESLLVGQWESVARSEGGVGTAIQFKPNGSVVAITVAMVEFKYSIDGDQLESRFVEPETGKVDDEPSTSTIRFDQDTLVKRDGPGEGQEVVMKRARPARPGVPRIVGQWSYPAFGATAFVTFTTKGDMLLRIPMSMRKGTWSAEGINLTIAYEGQRASRATYGIENGVLTIKSRGRAERYIRAHSED